MAGFEKEFANDGRQQQLAKHAKEAIPELFAAHAEDNPDHPGERRGNPHSPRLCDAHHARLRMFAERGRDLSMARKEIRAAYRGR